MVHRPVSSLQHQVQQGQCTSGLDPLQSATSNCRGASRLQNVDEKSSTIELFRNLTCSVKQENTFYSMQQILVQLAQRALTKVWQLRKRQRNSPG